MSTKTNEQRAEELLDGFDGSDSFQSILSKAMNEAEERGRQEERERAKGLLSLLKEMGDYLDHGFGTTICSTSGFHNNIKSIVAEYEKEQP
jgi:TRAP-type C4-dicarboxylate transport system substrate-binding protein